MDDARFFKVKCQVEAEHISGDELSDEELMTVIGNQSMPGQNAVYSGRQEGRVPALLAAFLRCREPLG
jgi:hypothetical protein